MMPGKRSRRSGSGHPMRRTTSLTEFALPEDVLADMAEQEQAAEEDEDLQLPVHAEEAAAEKEDPPYGWVCGGGGNDNGAKAAKAGTGRPAADCWLASYRARAAPALLGLRRNSADFSAAETAAFLRACGLCNRRLGPRRDTFMYRGDTAFCSLECRQQHISDITIEEWKEKCTALATVVTPQADDPAKPAASEIPEKSGAATTAGGMLAAA